MTTENKSVVDKQKPEKKSLDALIEAQQAKLAKLMEKKKQEDRRKLEKNSAAVDELIRGHKLNRVDVEVWLRALPKIKAALIEME